MSSGFRQGSILGGRYRLERILGVGGMASVWLARDERLHRPVALKILSDTLLADPSYLDRFRREAQLAAALSHPKLVRIYDFEGDGERPYLAMEYVEGETLADHLATGEGLGGSELHSLAAGLLEALEHIHRSGIIHRDVKPANVMITREGAVKLTDFGIAQPENATRLTRTGLVVGTLSYMAPEVLHGGPATPISDLYSCGVLLKEAGGEKMPAALKNLTVSLAADDPTGRPTSATEALAMLRRPAPTATTEPLPARTPNTPPTALRRQGPPRAILWAGGLALLLALIIAGASFLSGDGSPDRDAANRVEQESRDGSPNGSSQGSGQEATTDETPTQEASTEKAPTSETTTNEAPQADLANSADSQASGKSKEAKPAEKPEPPGKAKGLKKE